MSIVLDGTAGITTPNVASTTSTLGPLTQALNLGSTGQIVFPATQNASANANTLDDYEEGTFSPTYAGWTGTYSAQFGRYTKIGNLVYCFGRATTNAGTGVFTGSFADLTNLPFAGQPTGSAAKGMWFVTSGSTGLSSSETASGPLDGPSNGGTGAFPNHIVTGGNVNNFPISKLNASATVEVRFFVTYTT